MSNIETTPVKLSFDGDMRRFSLLKGTTYSSLLDQVVTLLALQKDADIVLKYTDEEGDLITISSDLELNSALVPKQLLRLVVTQRKNATAVLTPVFIPAPASVQSAPNSQPAPVVPGVPQPANIFKAFAHGCGRGAGGFRGGHHGGPRGPFGRGLSVEEWEKRKEEHRQARANLSPEEWEKRKEEWRQSRDNLSPEEWEKRKGEWRQARHNLTPEEWEKRKGEWKQARHNLTPEEWEKRKGEWKQARHNMSPEEFQKFKEERRQAREARGCPPGFGGRGGRWMGRGGCGGGKWGHGEGRTDRLIARFAKDVTIEDGSKFAPKTPFVKTWRLRNEGAEWPAGCVLRFLGKHSDSMSGPESVPVVGPVAPNTEVEITVNLIAPEKPGRYAGYWRMCDPEGRKFGQRVWVSIEVTSLGDISSSSSDEDKQADRFEALVDAVLARGVTAKRHRIFRLLQKFDGNVDLVCTRLAEKAHCREAHRARRANNNNNSH